MNMKTKKREANKETQTDKLSTRNVLVGTSASSKADREIQSQHEQLVVSQFNNMTDAEDTPQKSNQSHICIEESKSLAVSVGSDSKQAEEKEGDTSVKDSSSPSGRQVASQSDGLDESCEVVDTDRPTDTDALMKNHTTHNGSIAQVPGETIQKKFSKIVTFKLDESLD